jgi:hypothetical protein
MEALVRIVAEVDPPEIISAVTNDLVPMPTTYRPTKLGSNKDAFGRIKSTSKIGSPIHDSLSHQQSAGPYW